MNEVLDGEGQSTHAEPRRDASGPAA
jgi:hypothetical protein